MKIERRYSLPVWLAMFAALLGSNLGYAQSWARIVAENNLTPQVVASNDVPMMGTFWSLQQTNYPPLPFNPFPDLPVAYLGYGNSYLVDDSAVDYPALFEQWMMERTLRRLEQQYGLASSQSAGPPIPGDGEGGEYDEGGGGGEPRSYPSNALWLEITQITNGLAYVTLHGTVEDVAYEILSKEALTNQAWLSEGIIIGAEAQDWTPTTVTTATRTNTLFLWARSWVDSDGDGLPDWYENEVTHTDPNNPDTGGTGVSDGYKDGDNDGWNNLQEYQNGTNPNQFDTPPAPQGVQVNLSAGGSSATIRWQPAPGPVTGYTIERSFTNQALQVSSGTTQVTDSGVVFPDWLYYEFEAPQYRLRAEYSGGSSAWTQWLMPPECQAPDARSFSGSAGEVLVALQSLGNAAALRVGKWGVNGNYYPVSLTDVDLAPDSFANGLAAAPEPFASATNFSEGFAQFISSNGVPSAATFIGLPQHLPFWDGRQQLKQNLIFLLRAASVNYSFGYTYDDGYWGPYFIGSPADYACAGFYNAVNSFSTPVVDFGHFRPFDENYLFRNFVFSPTNLTAYGWFNTGLDWDIMDGLTLVAPAKFTFHAPPTVSAIPAVLAPSQFRWTSWQEEVPWSGSLPGIFEVWNEIGLFDDNGNFVMTNGARNLFGLPYLSVKLAWGSNTTESVTLNAGNSTPGQDSYVYPETAQPAFQTAGYFFGRVGKDWLPGHGAFSPTNTTPLLITPVGDTIRLAGYAKLAITNGYADRFGYLGQYFDKAFKIGTNGVVTTNQTGVLSPYGEFFPTEPGPTALVTMPDLDTNERGTAIVHVTKLQLDVNHDGEMDLSFAGPDNTSQQRPFMFWVNNDIDRGLRWGDGSVDPEDDLTINTPGPVAYERVPDSEYSYLHHYGATPIRRIPSLRDLEDFARLWICGVTTNLLPSLPGGAVVELSWGDKGNPNTNNPTIDLFRAADTNGFIAPYGSDAYLTNITSAMLQTNHLLYVQRLGPGDSLTGSAVDFLGLQRLIWCGVKRGSGKLTLAFKQGTNTIAETSAYIEIKDIKEMYERWTVGDNLQIAPTNKPYLASEDLPLGTPPFQYAQPAGTNTSYILLVHDYDLPLWKKDRYAETAFKRLYWHGYEGQFGLFRWPGVISSSSLSRPLDDSEFNAWRSGAGLLNLLSNLNVQCPNNVYLMAHGYGAVVAGEALRQAGTNQVVNTYIAMQGAVPSSAYDSSGALFRTVTPTWDSNTPDRYRYYNTSNAPPYFSGVGGAGTYINYYNPGDTLLTNLWRLNQDSKPALPLIPGYLYHWDGTNFLREYVPPLLLLFPADRYEIFAYCVEARSEAIGVQPNLGGVFDVSLQLNLSTLPIGILGFAGDHSGQFKSYSADTWPFWYEVLKSMRFK